MAWKVVILGFWIACAWNFSAAAEPLVLKEVQPKVDTLRSESLVVKVAPELGGKIISLQDGQGKEFLSRSRKPYVERSAKMTFGDSEFDGIDEIFPDMKGGLLSPAEAKAGWEVPDHGWLYCRKWRVQKQTPAELQLQADCAPAPVLFRRLMRVEQSSLVLDYEVENTGSQTLPFLYAFHPLLAGVDGGKIELPQGQNPQVITSWSAKGFLGPVGQEVTWQELRTQLLRGDSFRADSGRYYKYFMKGLGKGDITVRYPDGTGVRLEWPIERMPYLAVWCSEGGVDGLQHFAPEPTTSRYDSVREAVTHGDAGQLEPGKPLRWRIILTLLSGSASDAQRGKE